MRKLFTLTLVTVLFAGLYLAGCDTTTNTDPSISEQVGESLSAAKSAAKIDICHKRNGQGYISINISVNAEAAHRAHGDGMVGDPVPDLPGFIFDEDCVPVENCPCFDSADLQAGGAIFECGENFPGFPNLAGVRYTDGGAACSGEFCATGAPGVLSCAIATSSVFNVVIPITASEDASCRDVILDNCPSPNVSSAKAAAPASTTPFVEQ